MPTKPAELSPETKPYRRHGQGSIVRSVDARGFVTLRPRLRKHGREYWGEGVGLVPGGDAEAAQERAEANLAALRESVSRDQPVDPRKHRTSLRLFVERVWYKQLEKELPEDAQHRTRRNYEWAMDTHILPYLGGYPVTAISVPIVQRWRDELTEAKATRATIRWSEARLRQCLRAAVVAGYPVQDGVFLMKHVSVETAERPYLTPEQFRAVLDATTDPFWRRFWRAHFGAATRYGETAGVQRGDVDLDRATLTVRHQIDTKTNRPRPRPKDDSRGRIPLTSDATAALAEQIAAAEAALGRPMAPGELVFALGGRPPRYNLGLRRLRDAIEAANAADAGIDPTAATHSLRHGHAQVLLEENVPLSLISRKLRHRSERSTASYLHGLSADNLRGTADVIDRRFGKPASG